MTFSVEQTAFNQTLARYLTVRNRNVADSLNRKGADLGFKLIKYTPKAKRTDITKILRKNSSRYPGVPLAPLIINARNKRAGRPGLKGPPLARKAQDMVAARVHAIGFWKSGWIPGTAVLMRATGRTMRRQGSIATTRRRKGGATVATPSDMNVTLWNVIRSLDSRAESALDQAFREVRQDMEVYLARRFASVASTIP